MSTSSSKLCYAALKLDMNKAYDRVNWNFLWDILLQFGFPPYLIHLLQQCVTTVSYQILVNGSPTQTFRPQCSLRQGNPLSPYLFVMCMEVFSSMFRRDEGMGLFQGLQVSRRAPSISHLFFADDALLFFKVSPSVCDHILSVTNEFCSVSGQIISLQKSFVRFSPNTPDDYRDFLSSALPMQSRSSIGDYLGMPVDLGRSKCKDFQFMVDKVVKRLASYATFQLSAAAKLVIINSIVVASFNHILSVFKVSASICDRIDSLLSRFLWRSAKDSKGIALASSSMTHLPKGSGDLGIRQFRAFNLALLGKQAWRLMHNPQLLVSRMYKARFLMLLNPRPSLSCSRPSWGSRGLLDGGLVISTRSAWKIGRGDQVSILGDCWLPGVDVCFNPDVPEANRPSMVSDLMLQDSCSWDSSLIRHLFPQHVASAILGLDRSRQKIDDLVYWKFTRDGSFFTKSAYSSLLDQHTNLSTATVPGS